MRKEEYGTIKIVDKYTQRVILCASLAKKSNPAKVLNVAMSMLPCLYATGRKGKAQYWIMPKAFGAKLQVALGWEDGYKKHATLFKLGVKWEDER